MFSTLLRPKPVGKYIVFEDPEAERVLMAHGVSSDGIGITLEDAERVTTISTWFKGNTTLASFEEFAYFINCAGLAASAFDGCTSLTKIKLPTSLTTIGAYALRNVPAPVVLDAPNLTTIGTAAFYASGLTEIKDLGKAQIIGSTGAVVQATSGVFANCKSLVKAHIPASVTHIGGMSFVGCTALNTITGCEGVTNIVRQQAFDGCSALTGALILPSVKVIDQYSFRNCKLTSIDLGADTTTIAAYAFQNNTALNAFICRATTPPSLGNANAFSNTNNCPIYVPDASVEAYKGATNWNTYADRIRPLSEIEGSPYIQFEDSEAERVLMSKGVSSDGIGITKADAEAVTSMQGWFKNNTAIKAFNELQYFTGMTTLSQDIFFGSSIESVIFPPTMTELGDYCFYQSTGMRILRVPVSVTSMGNYVTSYSAITVVIMESETPPTIGQYAFRYHGGKVSIYVPDASVEAYKTATNWSGMSAYIKGISEYSG